MEVASLCSLPVGLVPWASPEPTCTVVIKATFSLDEDGDAALLETQEPLAIDRPSAIDPDELSAASDFAPLKARADVLLLGHAKADEPCTAIPALLRVDGLTRRFFALAGAPSAQIPLAAPYLRAAGGESDEVIRVGPEAPWSSARQARLGDRALDAHGLPVGPLARGFDFGFFNAAPPEQQIELLRPSATLLLRGLIAGAERREVRLPGVRPVVFLMRQATSGRTSADEIALRCDTLVIDVDRALCTLTWRGVFEPPADEEPACLLVDLAWPGEKPTFRELRRKLALASEAEASPPRDTPPETSPEPEEISADEWIEEDEVEVDEPTGRHAPIRDGAASRGAGFRLGLPLGAAPIRASQVDSFEVQANPEVPEPPTAQVIEETIRLTTRELDAAFASWEQEAEPSPTTAPMPTRTRTLSDTANEGPTRLGSALPFASEPATARAPRRRDTLNADASPPANPLPFRAAEEARAAWSAEPDPRSETQTEAPVVPKEALPFGGAEQAARAVGPQPVRGIALGQGLGAPFGIALGRAVAPAIAPAQAPEIATRVDAKGPLSLKTYAAIKAALREGPASRADVLGRHGLDEIAWSQEEQRRAEELAADAREGNTDRVLAFHAALRAAAEDAREEGPAVPLDRYVALRVALEDGADAAVILSAQGLSPAAYRRLHRTMTRRATADPAFGQALWNALVEARRDR